MNQPLTADMEHVRKLVAQVGGADSLSAEQRQQALEVFEAHECWGPYFRILQTCLKDPTQRQLADYLRLARVQNLYLEDVFAAAETCTTMVTDLKLSYADFNVNVLPRIVEFEDFAAEATILSAVSGRFSTHEDHVASLERLCMLYEKKTHNEALLGKSYEKLLALDGRNVKALRYFKLVYTQNGDWEEVVGVLKTLLASVAHPQELFRVAQELAAIFLYQLDMAEEAINVLETHCNESPLDTSTILFDAYQRLGNWNGCLKVLRQCLLNIDDDIGRAILHYKIGGLHEQLGELDPAMENFTKAAKLWPNFLDAIEGIVAIGAAKQDWKLIQGWLSTLTEHVQDDRLRSQLKQAARRLQDGVEHARKS